MTEERLYSKLNTMLLESFPQLTAAYREAVRVSDGDEPGPHVVFGDVLTPHIIHLLESDGHDSELKAIFEFLEALVPSCNSDVRDVVGASVCERLNDRRSWRERARTFMGANTLQLSKDLERAWG